MDPVIQCAKLAGWPEDPKLLGFQRLLALRHFSTQPLDFERLRTATFREMVDLFSSAVVVSWGEAEWMEVVEGLRRGSVAEVALVADAVRKQFVGTPEEFDRLMRALYYPEEDSKRSRSPSVPGNSEGGSPSSSKVRQPEAEACSDENGNSAVASRKSPDAEGANLNGSFLVPDPPQLAVTGSASEGPLQSVSVGGEGKDGDEEESSSGRKRKRSASPFDANLSGDDVVSLFERVHANILKNSKVGPSSGPKKMKITQSSKSFAEKLTASDFTRLLNTCAPIDVLKWEEIVERCCNADSDILLPEGVFYFPTGYTLTAKSPGLKISGQGPDKTILCFLPRDHHDPGNNFVAAGSPQKRIALKLGSTITLENLAVKRASTRPFWWPVVTLDVKNCVVKNVHFFGCGLEIESGGNVVENCRFYGGLSSHDLDRDVPAVRFEPMCKAISLECSWGGNIIKDVYIQDVFYGVSEYRAVYSDGNSTNLKKPDNIVSDLTCQNVRIGVSLFRCEGEIVKNVTYHWTSYARLMKTWKDPTAVEIYGCSEGNLVEGILCKGDEDSFYAFTFRRFLFGEAPKRNVIRDVKGDRGRCRYRYINEGSENWITDYWG